jgi:peptidoglycan hydrolase-like protein with peptidoglycan-binding domain
MGAITRSVGLGGANDPADVSEIQRLLNAAPAAQGGATPPLSVDGICGPATRAAILRFQRTQVPAFADGRIDAGGPTLARLNTLASVPGAAFAAGATGSLSDVARARGIGLAWLGAVEPAITGFVFSVGKKLTPAQAPSLALIEDAFHKHFKLILDASKKTAAHPNVKVFNPVTDAVFIPTIRANFRAIFGVVGNPAKFELITEATAKAEGGVNKDGTIVAAYVKGVGTNVKVTPAFNSPTRGANCQAAIIVHESTHVVDGTSGDPAKHISEWASNDPPISGKFGDPGYDRQTPEDAIHNPSAYASFAAHVARGRDERFGDGRQTE